MNKYIFITNSIRYIGGGQLYVARKTEWLKANGWDVQVYYTDYGPVYIDTLKPYKKNHVKELLLPFEIASTKTKKKVSDIICPSGNVSKIIYETHLVHLSIWGEYLASISKGMHLCYFLSEGFPKITTQQRHFLEYKLRQDLLFGISNGSIPLLLGSSSLTENRGLIAVGCSEGNVEDIEYPLCKEVTNGINILHIGRLEKPYVPSMIQDLASFISEHPKDHFNIIFVGDTIFASKVDFSSLQEKPNISVHFTGYLHPVPRQLIKMADVAIACAGSIRLSAQEKVLTIAIDSNDHKAMGIYGITTNNIIFREEEPLLEIKDLLQQVIYEKIFSPEDIKCDYTNALDYSKHLKIIESYKIGNFYDMYWSLTIRKALWKMIYLIMGFKLYRFLYKHYNQLFG